MSSKAMIPVDIFKRGVLIFVGTLDELAKELKRYGFSEAERGRVVDEFKGIYADEKRFGSTSAVCSKIENDVVIHSKAKLDVPVLVHELSHATTLILDMVGVDDDETRAYVLEYMFNRVVNDASLVAQ